MGLNWAVVLPGLFAGTFTGYYICRNMSLLLIFLVLCAQVSEFTRVCIGHNRETFYLFDLSPHELVPDADSIRPTEFEKKRPTLACVNTAILGEAVGNIGRYVESRYKIFEEAD